MAMAMTWRWHLPGHRKHECDAQFRPTIYGIALEADTRIAAGLLLASILFFRWTPLMKLTIHRFTITHRHTLWLTEINVEKWRTFFGPRPAIDVVHFFHGKEQKHISHNHSHVNAGFCQTKLIFSLFLSRTCSFSRFAVIRIFGFDTRTQRQKGAKKILLFCERNDTNLSPLKKYRWKVSLMGPCAVGVWHRRGRIQKVFCTNYFDSVAMFEWR